LQVVAVGVGGFGAWTLQALAALREQGVVRVVGVSDVDGAVAKQAGVSLDVPYYTDNRSLLAETRPAAAFLAVPPMAAPDLIATCAERETHVWKELPLARNLEEALAVVRRMEQAQRKLAVGTQWRFAPGYRAAREMVGELGEVYLARAHYLFNWGTALQWRSDRASAGGGALLELGYHAIDLLIWLMGMPEEVYGVSVGNHRPDDVGPDGQPLPPYDTDDTATAVLRFAEGRMASVVVSRTTGPVTEGLTLHGRRGSITATSERCVLRDPDGNVLDQRSEQPSSVAVFQRQLEAFVTSVVEGNARYECSGRENLLTQAVIEAVYLSNRTSQSEEPGELLKANRITADKCLATRPVGA
jgi:predicted dehydrogenase